MPNEQLDDVTDETKEKEWYEDRAEQEPPDDYPIDQYDLTATPNDFRSTGQ